VKCNRNQLADILGRDLKTIDRMVGQGMPYLSRPGENGATGWLFESADAISWTLGTWNEGRLDEGQSDGCGRCGRAKGARLSESPWFGVGSRGSPAALSRSPGSDQSRLLAVPRRMGLLAARETDEKKIVDLLSQEIDAAFRPLDDFMTWFGQETERRNQRAAKLLGELSVRGRT
jgi:hypothetical protein